MIGVVGLGVVGSAVVTGYTKLGIKNIQTFDTNGSGNCTTLEKLINNKDVKYIFICVPTPMTDDCADYSAVLDLCERIDHLLIDNTKPVIIKSTVSPNFLRWVDKEYSYPIIANPEFLSEKTALEDFLNPTRLVWGCDDYDLLLRVVRELSQPYWAYDDVQTYTVKLEIAMKIKYACNAFSALKITFFNIINEWCDDDFCVARNVIIDGGWINAQHTQVPGPDGKYGFGGKCLPKDLNAMSSALKEDNIVGGVLLDEVARLNDTHFRPKGKENK